MKMKKGLDKAFEYLDQIDTFKQGFERTEKNIFTLIEGQLTIKKMLIDLNEKVEDIKSKLIAIDSLSDFVKELEENESDN